MFDIKETEEEKHISYTGVPLKPILENMSALNEMKIPFIIRAPIIPTLNDRASHFAELRKLRETMEFCKGIEIMPYHKPGEEKYKLLGRDYACKNIEAPSAEQADFWGKLI